MHTSSASPTNLPSYSTDYDFNIRKDRIEFALRQAGTNENQVASTMNFSQSSLNQYKTGSTKRFQRLTELAETLGVNARWLDSGEGSPFLGTPKDPAHAMFIEIKMNQHFYETYYKKKYPNKKHEALSIQLSCSDHEKLNSKFLSYILMPDDSMTGEINDKSVVVIDENDIYIENGKLYAVKFFDEVSIRRTFKINKNITLKTSNTDYPEQIFEREMIDSSGFDVLGRVKLVKNYYI